MGAFPNQWNCVLHGLELCFPPSGTSFPFIWNCGAFRSALLHVLEASASASIAELRSILYIGVKREEQKRRIFVPKNNNR